MFEIDCCFEIQGEQETVLMRPSPPFGCGIAGIKLNLNVGFEALYGSADLLVDLPLSIWRVSNR